MKSYTYKLSFEEASDKDYVASLQNNVSYHYLTLKYIDDILLPGELFSTKLAIPEDTPIPYASLKERKEIYNNMMEICPAKCVKYIKNLLHLNNDQVSTKYEEAHNEEPDHYGTTQIQDDWIHSMDLDD